VGGTHTRDTGGKDRKIHYSIPAASFSPVFVAKVAGLDIPACATSAPHKIPKFTPELRGELSSPMKYKGRGLVQCEQWCLFLWRDI